MRVAFIGAGAMVKAIAKGAHQGDPNAWDFVFCSKNHDSARQLANEVRGTYAATASEAIVDADLIVLGVKPYTQQEVIKALPFTQACVVSIAAGRTIASIQEDFAQTPSANIGIIRVMPNINANVGQSASAICANETASDNQIGDARKLFDAVGITLDIPEHLFSAFIAMAGSSPAWFFAIADHLASAGVKHGLSKSLAMKAVVSSMAGSAALLAQALDNGENAQVLIDRVCSPGGTTIAGLLAAERDGLGPSLVSAVDATISKDRDLSNKG